MTPRTIRRHYIDPLDAVWRAAAHRIGMRVVRSPDVYASWDGAGTLRIGTPETLDPDDCLAQMVFHELCHSLIQGPDAWARTDFGLDNASDRDAERERACLRLQAALADEHGLRDFLAPTTDFRPFYDALGADPLGDDTNRAVVLAKAARGRVDTPPWGPHLRRALRATAGIASEARDAGTDQLVDADGRPALYADVNPPRGRGSP